MKHALLLLTVSSALLAHAQPNTQWLRTAGGFSQYAEYRSATDATGHLYTAGEGAAMDFGNGVTVPGEGEVIARYDSSGTINWARAVTTTAGEMLDVTAIATNSEGDLWITGRFNSFTLTLDAIVLTSTIHGTAFLARFDSTGAVEFAISWGGSGTSSTRGFDLCTDGLNNVYVTGDSDADTFTVGSITLTNPSGEEQLFALMFDAGGTPVWGSISSAPLGATRGFCIGTDAAGNAYVVGKTTGVFIIGEDTVDTGFITQAMLIKFNSTGAVDHMDVLAECFPLDMAVDDAGNAYVCGMIESTAIFNSDTLVPSVVDGFVAAYDSNGDYRWVVGVQGEIDNELCWSVDLDAAETGLVVGGTFVFDAWFGDLHVETGTSPTDGFVMQLDTAGTVNWVKDMTGDGPTLVAQACLDPWGHLYASGVTQSTSTYLNEAVLNGGGNHAFLARFRDLATAVPSVARAGDLHLYPNPCEGTFTIDLPAEAHTVIIEDVQGREQERRSVRSSHASTFRIGVPGVYFVTVLTDAVREVQKVVVE